MNKFEKKQIVECLAQNDTWQNERKMTAMMSTFKRRDVNAHEYDARIKFWTRLIIDTCLAVNNPIVQYKQLLHRFTRADRVPAGLVTVLEHMTTERQVMTVDAFKSSTTLSWMSWGVDALVKRPVGWLTGWGASTTNDADMHGQMVVLEVIDKIANEVMACHSSAVSLGGDSSFARLVVNHADVLAATRHIVHDEYTLDLALCRLVQLGHVHISSSAGARLVKFSDGTDTGRVQVTEIDHNVVKMRTALHHLERERETLAKKAAVIETETRAMLRAGNKTRALAMFKQKKAIESRLGEKDRVYANMCELLDKVESTGDQRQVLDAYKSGVAAFKQTLARHGLSAGEIDHTIDDIHDAMGEHEDIQAALSFNAGSTTCDEADLESELAELMNDDVSIAARPKAKAVKRLHSNDMEPVLAKERRIVDVLPDVPTHMPGFSPSTARINRIPLRTTAPPTATALPVMRGGGGVKQLTIRGRPSFVANVPAVNSPITDRLAELRRKLQEG